MSKTTFPKPGTNLGNRLAKLRRAGAHSRDAIDVISIFSIYESAPRGITDQPAFLNLCLSAETELSPYLLLTSLKNIEQQPGCGNSICWCPRLIDIVLLLYDDRRLESPDLTIPRHFLAKRTFVLEPAAEIPPEGFHPGQQITLQPLAEAIDCSGPGKTTALPDTILFIDTNRPETAQTALDVGAVWINDIWVLSGVQILCTCMRGKRWCGWRG